MPLISRIRAAVNFARQGGRFRFDETARMYWHAIYPDLSDGASGLFGAVTSRAEAQVVRLALIYALLFASNPERAFRRRACPLGLLRIVGAVDEILAALHRKPAGMSRTEISKLFSRNKTSEEIGQALSLLQKEGRVKTEQLETPSSRSPEIWTAVKPESIISSLSFNSSAI